MVAIFRSPRFRVNQLTLYLPERLQALGPSQPFAPGVAPPNCGPDVVTDTNPRPLLHSNARFHRTRFPRACTLRLVCHRDDESPGLLRLTTGAAFGPVYTLTVLLHPILSWSALRCPASSGAFSPRVRPHFDRSQSSCSSSYGPSSSSTSTAQRRAQINRGL